MCTIGNRHTTKQTYHSIYENSLKNYVHNSLKNHYLKKIQNGFLRNSHFTMKKLLTNLKQSSE